MFSRFDVCWTQTKRQAEDRKQGRKSQKSLSKSEKFTLSSIFLFRLRFLGHCRLCKEEPIEILPTVHLSIFK